MRSRILPAKWSVSTPAGLVLLQLPKLEAAFKLFFVHFFLDIHGYGWAPGNSPWHSARF